MASLGILDKILLERQSLTSSLLVNLHLQKKVEGFGEKYNFLKEWIAKFWYVV